MIANAPDGTYFVRVRAFNNAGFSTPSNERIITTTPSACVGAFVATLTWDTGSVTGTPYQVDIDLHTREPGNEDHDDHRNPPLNSRWRASARKTRTAERPNIP